MPKPVIGTARREPCFKCGLPVVIAERLHVSGQLYHRTCFICSRCNAQLTLGNYCESEIEHQFCCETCPDEEPDSPNINRSLSDEEKSASIKQLVHTDDYYSDLFETALEDPKNSVLTKSDTLDNEQTNAFVQARSHFMTSQLEPPDLLKFVKKSEDLDLVDSLKDNTCYNDSTVSNSSGLDLIIISSDSDSDNNQQKTANSLLENITKDSAEEDAGVISGITNTSYIKHEDENCLESASPIVIDSSVSLLEKPIIKALDDSLVATDKEIPDNIESVISISSDDFSKNSLEDTSDCIINTTEEETAQKEPIPEVNRNKDYPEDLNPFGDDDVEEEEGKRLNVSLNPFDEDEDDEVEEDILPKPTGKKKVSLGDISRIGPYLYTQRISDNPFEREKQQPVVQTRKFIKAPKISLDYGIFDRRNAEGRQTELETPVPLPRKDRPSIGTPNPTPRKSGLEASSIFGSNTSLSSAHSSIEPGRRKKKPAPKPPTNNLNAQESAHSSLASTPCTSAQHSPKSLARSRKLKKAPPPPSSTPLHLNHDPERILTSPILLDDQKLKIDMENCDIEKEKVVKDEVNRNRQSQLFADSQSLSNIQSHKQKRMTKGPAPSRPVAEKRTVKPFPMQEIKHELDVLEIQMQGLEKQGVRLEELIREKCEAPGMDVDTPITPEVDSLILELFEIVNEKNVLFRRQAELMYLRRQQRLEEEYADLEYQIRCLLLVPEPNKTDSDKTREEELIKRLYEVVEQRNEIVECLEMDRVREAEEDASIHTQLTTYSSQSTKICDESSPRKKTKKFKLKSNKKVDIDKDIDECEVSLKKDKKKKKFSIF